jgi:hypothetical protein
MSETTIFERGNGLTDTAAETAVAMAQALASAQGEAFHSAKHAGATMLEGLTKAQKEASDFLSERIHQDLETQAELLRCRTFDEIREVQTRFFRTAMDQYSAEATKLIRIGSEMMAPAQSH